MKETQRAQRLIGITVRQAGPQKVEEPLPYLLIPRHEVFFPFDLPPSPALVKPADMGQVQSSRFPGEPPQDHLLVHALEKSPEPGVDVGMGLFAHPQRSLNGRGGTMAVRAGTVG